MRIILTLFLVFFGRLSFAQCECEATANGHPFFSKTVGSSSQCKQALANHAAEAKKTGAMCPTGDEEKREFQLTWSCGKLGENPEKHEKIFACDELEDISHAQELLKAALYASNYADGAVIEPKAPSPECGEDAAAPPLAPEDHKIVLKIKNQEELKSVLRSMLPKDSEKSVLDSVEDGNIRFLIHNDYALTGESKSDDVGDTHGFELTFTKAAGDGYNLQITYESNLYTNFADPKNIAFWTDEDGNYHFAQYYIEENIGKIILEKQASGDAFYWRLGGGLQELNKSDGEGTFGVLSALGSQAKFHETVAENSGGARLYDNLGQEGDEISPFVEMDLGKRQTLIESGRSKVFVKGEVGSRITGIDDASYLSGSAEAHFERLIGETFTVRVGGGYRAELYADDSQTEARYVDVVVGSRKFKAGMRYEKRFSKVPGYQNALPPNYVNRDLYAPKDDAVWSVYVQYNW